MYRYLLLLSKENLWILQLLYFSTNINYKKVHIFAMDNDIKYLLYRDIQWDGQRYKWTYTYTNS